MPVNYDQPLQRILEIATSGPRETLVNRLRAVVVEHEDAATPVVAMGAICYGRANSDIKLSEQEIGVLREWSVLARQRAEANPSTPEALTAQAGAALFTLVARQAAGEAVPVGEQRKAVADARERLERSARGSNVALFDVLAAAALRFFPAKLRDNQAKDLGVNRLTRFGRVAGPAGTLARLMFAEHLMRRGQGKKLGAIATRLAEDLPEAACVQAFQGAAAISAGDTAAAENHFAKALELNPKEASIRKALVQILRANGKEEQARQVERAG